MQFTTCWSWKRYKKHIQFTFLNPQLSTLKLSYNFSHCTGRYWGLKFREVTHCQEMLLESGDLIPVRPEAVEIPWTRRKAQILNFLLRGPVSFKVRSDCSSPKAWRELIYFRPKCMIQMLGTLPPYQLTSIRTDGQWRISILNLARGQVLFWVTLAFKRHCKKNPNEWLNLFHT